MSDTPACPTPSAPATEPVPSHQLVMPEVAKPPTVFPHCVSAYRRTVAERLRDQFNCDTPDAP